MRSSALRPIVMLAVLLTGVSCGQTTDGQVSAAQVRDSAGIAVVDNARPDVRLKWTFEPLWTLGDRDEGPGAFFRIDRGALSTDGSGRLYVLDQGDHEVRVFTTEGRHLRSFGRRGAGPGELRFPFALAVDDRGAASVVDVGKGALVRFDSSGAPLSEVTLSRPYLIDPAYAGDLLVAALQHRPAARDSTLRELVVLENGEYIPLARHRGAPPSVVDLGCAQLTGLPRIFEPEMHTAVLRVPGRIVVSRSPAYRMEVFDTSGRLRRLVRRSVSPMPASARLAAAELGRDRLTYPGSGAGACEVGADAVVAARGFAEVVPAVRGLVSTFEGGWWVVRGIGPVQRHFDVFSAGGAYVGSLPAGTPRPAVFIGPDRFVAIERDDLDRLLLRAYRVRR